MKARPGYTLTEVLVAALLIAIIAVGVGRVLGQAARHTRASHYRTTAAHLAQNEIERLRVAGPGPASTLADTVRVAGTGEVDPDGTYRLEITALVRCEGGVAPRDNSAVPLPIDSTCAVQRPIREYTVRVFYPVDGEEDASSVVYVLTLGSRSVHSDQVPGR